MARAREEAAWLKLAVGVAWIINRNGWTRKPVDPRQIIPEEYRPRPVPPAPKSDEELAEESRRAWYVLDRFFGQKG